jgi:ubiquinone/menaquinone biosynthesis C-methylase UbiE
MIHDKKDVIQANIQLHSALADKYKETEPHYRAENILRVRNILSNLHKRTSGTSLLDVGCGMGFIIDIAKHYFPVVRGVDVTQAMLDRIDTTHDTHDIKVQLAESDHLPYADDFFDVCTAYAVLHHLDSLEPTFKEIHRVLKKGGVFYSDLDPNFYFWEAISGLSQNREYPEIVSREIDAVLNKDRELEEQFGIDRNILRLAEHLKHDQKGFTEEYLRERLHDTGFVKVDIKYEWFLGEAKAIHGGNEDALTALRKYLQEILPLSRHLFKYLIIYAEK